MKKKLLSMALCLSMTTVATAGIFTVKSSLTTKAEPLNTGYTIFQNLNAVKLKAKSDLYMWTYYYDDSQGKTVTGGLRSDNIFYPYGQTNFNVRFLPTNIAGVYQIQLPGNYFMVDDSRVDSAGDYKIEHRYYLLGQRPKYSNQRALWKVIESSYEGKPQYKIQNLATGRYMCSKPVTLGHADANLKLVAAHYPTSIYFTTSRTGY